MKKVLIFLGIIVLIFASILILNNVNNQKLLKDNPYGTNDLEQATIDQLDDPNYQNIILPDELNASLANEENKTVYFFSPLCSYCKQTTPIIVPLAEEMGVELELYNILEFNQESAKYNVTKTPTLIYFENGKEVQRFEGAADKQFFENWFNSYVLNEE